MGASASWNLQGLSRAVMGLLYLYLMYIKQKQFVCPYFRVFIKHRSFYLSQTIVAHSNKLCEHMYVHNRLPIIQGQVIESVPLNIVGLCYIVRRHRVNEF